MNENTRIIYMYTYIYVYIYIPNKFDEIIKNLYDKTECSIIVGGEL